MVNGSSSSPASRGSAGRRSRCEVPPPQAYFNLASPANAPGPPPQPAQRPVHVLTRPQPGQPAESSAASGAGSRGAPPAPAVAVQQGVPGTEAVSNVMSEEALGRSPPSAARTNNRRARRAHLQAIQAGGAPNQARLPQQQLGLAAPPPYSAPPPPPQYSAPLPPPPLQGSCMPAPPQHTQQQQQQQLWGSPGTAGGMAGLAPSSFEALLHMPPPGLAAPPQRASSAQPPCLSPLHLGASPTQGVPACTTHSCGWLRPCQPSCTIVFLLAAQLVKGCLKHKSV